MDWVKGNREQRRFHNMFGLAAGLLVVKLAIISQLVGGSQVWYWGVGVVGIALFTLLELRWRRHVEQHSSN
ncbi:hypothetical protein [Candidatus Poriferisodalis sp.]|uniref:hypothetical protein n=1 Tax=Candidatus Poriferisodalis sp. TaxID=3101277 RepID=UPI003C6FDDAF